MSNEQLTFRRVVVHQFVLKQVLQNFVRASMPNEPRDQKDQSNSLCEQ